MKDVKPQRNEKGHWLPGSCPNPGGRKPGLEKRVRELVDFDKITLALQAIALGQVPEGVSMSGPPKYADRIKAAALLYDRAYGKARQIVDLAAEIGQSGIGGVDVDRLDKEAFAALERSLMGALASATVLDAKTVENEADE